MAIKAGVIPVSSEDRPQAAPRSWSASYPSRSACEVHLTPCRPASSTASPQSSTGIHGLFHPPSPNRTPARRVSDSRPTLDPPAIAKLPQIPRNPQVNKNNRPPSRHPSRPKGHSHCGRCLILASDLAPGFVGDVVIAGQCLSRIEDVEYCEDETDW